MAKKRMFSQNIVCSDDFLDMPPTTQMLYFHLNLQADDEGFMNNPKSIQRSIGASKDDLELLVEKKLIICFDNGVVAIRHWYVHNALRKDRQTPTQFQKELKSLAIEGGIYNVHTLGNQVPTKCQPSANQVPTKCQPSANQVPTKCQPSANHLPTK